MTQRFSVPRGTADILPDTVANWQNMERIARDYFQLFHYRELRTPCFEETELFARSMGQTTEVVQKQMLRLQSQKEDESSPFALRPEGTAAILRAYIQYGLVKQESLSKFFYMGPMFRGERPQKGRLRQFHQMGVEAIGAGTASPFLDAEVIALAVNLLKAFGCNPFQLKVNTLGSLSDKNQFASWLRGNLESRLNQLEPELQQSFRANIFRILDSKDPAAKALIRDLNFDGNYLSAESREYFAQVKSALDSLRVEYTVVPQLVRGLDYYTHTVFEFSDPSLGSQDALGAGGRYNGLARQLGAGIDIDAIGFALGMERILLSAAGQQSIVPESISYYIISLDEAFIGKAFWLQDIIRRQGVSCDMSYRGGSVKSLMRSANKSGAKYTIILGQDEIIKNELTVKIMHSGEQLRVALDQIEEFLKNHR